MQSEKFKDKEIADESKPGHNNRLNPRAFRLDSGFLPDIL